MVNTLLIWHHLGLRSSKTKSKNKRSGNWQQKRTLRSMSSTSQRRLVISQTVASNFCFYTKLVKNLLRGESRFEKYVFRCRLPDQLFSDFVFEDLRPRWCQIKKVFIIRDQTQECCPCSCAFPSSFPLILRRGINMFRSNQQPAI